MGLCGPGGGARPVGPERSPKTFRTFYGHRPAIYRQGSPQGDVPGRRPEPGRAAAAWGPVGPPVCMDLQVENPGNPSPKLLGRGVDFARPRARRQPGMDSETGSIHKNTKKKEHRPCTPGLCGAAGDSWAHSGPTLTADCRREDLDVGGWSPGGSAVPLLQTPGPGPWPCRVLSCWPGSWRKLPARPQSVRARSPSAVWMGRTPMPPARAQACAAQAATGSRMRTAPPAASAAGMAPSRPPAMPLSADTTAPGWQPPSSWGPSSSVRGSFSLWPASSTSSEPAGSPRSSMARAKPPPCSLQKPPP
ncbi:uncharacterized protein C1orf159 homolog isoform X2 [Talpa occidentalis]|uniref:uncharacterized protein C1orf159 homolog isoform X2 n=1 Tax=Talpa occidentalis TaxID=50954 RepID=UPI0023F8903F|nr:uncharacterized protein C1orf159 homolog isoform X2 [Talpa occidentalis]